jgi:hypothetical protein
MGGVAMISGSTTRKKKANQASCKGKMLIRRIDQTVSLGRPCQRQWRDAECCHKGF